jgi:hypothetical protein
LKAKDIYAASGTSETVFFLTTVANELQTELEWLKAILEQLNASLKDPSASSPMVQDMAGPVRAALVRLRPLMPLLKKFLSKLWSVISHLLIPQEWKLSGKIGSTVLGLGEVKIEITFGP